MIEILIGLAFGSFVNISLPIYLDAFGSFLTNGLFLKLDFNAGMDPLRTTLAWYGRRWQGKKTILTGRRLNWWC
jgi:hypothetical protein